MESICCSPPDSVPAVCLRRSARRGNRANDAFLHVGERRAGEGRHAQVLEHARGSGKMPRPSGTTHTPARASASTATPFTVRPNSENVPDDGTI